MRKTRMFFFLVGSASLVAIAPQCGGGGSTDCTQTSTCPSDASDGPPPLNCNMSVDPKNSLGCVDDRVGIFVSPTGSDTNAGTKEAPVKTITKGLSIVGALTRVYVCAGTYAENISLAPPADGISIYGGFACADWSYSGTQPTVGNGTIALTISGTTKPIAIEDLILQSAAGAPSSIAALVANATGAVTFTRVNFTASAGAAGTNGITGTNYDTTLLSNDPKIEGNSATGGGTGNGAAQVCAGLCTDNVTSTGGAGGQGGTSTQGGASGSPSLGGLPPNDGAGGNGGSVACTPGDQGANETTVGASATSPTALGSLTATGWSTTAPIGGTNGGPGQGGGGGGGHGFTNNTAGGGGGGGCGGCGGAGGAGGQGGGASIALAVFSSTVSVNSSVLIAGNAGNGGKGATGQTGQTGGLNGNGSTPGCAGGGGGTGGTGGTSAGGVGGISVGVLYKGNAPTLDSASMTATTFGTAGTKGTGGTAGTNDGIDGVAMATMQSP